MATLGDKVTDTIVNALGKGLQGAGMAQHDDLKSIVAPRVESYLAQLDPDSPEYHELERLTSNSTVVDVFLMFVGTVIALVTSIFDLAEPRRELIRHQVWQAQPYKYPAAQNIIVAQWRGAISDKNALTMLRELGYAEVSRDAMDSALRQPLRAEDILELRRRGYVDSAKMVRLLDGAGFDAEARAGLLQLQWRIPPVPDLIRMAVREAFSPEIAQRFGQYQDFPGDVAAYAKMQGLSEEWAQRYWAAHWELPSANMGFEMVHRGIITEADLDMLLRAQDVMPFWRDKMKAIAFNPLTRVDVRRMYQLGIIDEAAVLKAYKDLGYSDENAGRLTEFCKRYYGVEEDTEVVTDREYTKAEILDGYRKGILSAAQAQGSLQDMGYSPEQADFYLSREDLKATQERKQAYIDRWHSLFVEGQATADDVSSNLTTLGITSAEIDELLPLWYLEQIQRVAKPSRTDLNRFLKKGIISEATWRQQMQLLGYADQYIEWYLADAAAE